MVDVIAWPPVAAIGRDFTSDYPVSRSRSLFTGRRYVSAAQAKRKVATLQVSGIGSDLGSAGYVEMLKERLEGGVNLVRINSASQAYYRAVANVDLLRGERPMDWAVGDRSLDWTSGGAAMDWVVGAPVSGTAGTLQGMPVLYCAGLPRNRRIAWPSEVVRVVDESEVAHTARVMRVAVSDATGAAVLYLDAALPDGDVLIGFRESVVYEVENANDLRAVQPVHGDWSYTFRLREVFEAETDGFVEVDPWR